MYDFAEEPQSFHVLRRGGSLLEYSLQAVDHRLKPVLQRHTAGSLAPKRVWLLSRNSRCEDHGNTGTNRLTWSIFADFLDEKPRWRGRRPVDPSWVNVSCYVAAWPLKAISRRVKDVSGKTVNPQPAQLPDRQNIPSSPLGEKGLLQAVRQCRAKVTASSRD